jgi:hypothetical protein
MKLAIKPLDNVSSENHWNYASEISIQEGQINDFYIQIVDMSKQLVIRDDGAAAPLRYIVQGTSKAVSIQFPSLDDADVFTIIGSAPFSDKSIWKFSLSSSQTPKSGSIKVTLTEDGISKSFIASNVMSVELLNVGSC